MTHLTPDPRNANKGTDEGSELLAASLARYGAGRSVLVDKDGRIIAGNKTVEAAEAAGIPFRVIETTGDEVVVVQRTDLELGPTGKARELAYVAVTLERMASMGLDPTLIDG